MKKDELLERFKNNIPDGLANVKNKIILAAAYSLGAAINKVCPESREKSLAITKTEEAMMWANYAISRMSKRNGGNEND